MQNRLQRGAGTSTVYEPFRQGADNGYEGTANVCVGGVDLMAEQPQRAARPQQPTEVAILAVSRSELIALWAVLLTTYQDSLIVETAIGRPLAQGLSVDVAMLLRRVGYLIETFDGIPPDDMPLELR